MTDNYELLSEALGKAADLQRELAELRALITEWADADDAWCDVNAFDSAERSAYYEAYDALRKAVGR